MNDDEEEGEISAPMSGPATNALSNQHRNNPTTPGNTTNATNNSTANNNNDFRGAPPQRFGPRGSSTGHLGGNNSNPTGNNPGSSFGGRHRHSFSGPMPPAQVGSNSNIDNNNSGNNPPHFQRETSGGRGFGPRDYRNEPNNNNNNSNPPFRPGGDFRNDRGNFPNNNNNNNNPRDGGNFSRPFRDPRDMPPFAGMDRGRPNPPFRGHKREGSFGGGRPEPRPFGPRRDSYHRLEGGREPSFSDMAGPPRDRPFRDDGPPPHRGSLGGGPPMDRKPGGFERNQSGGFGPNNPPMDPRRPTDPRRRSETGPPPGNHDMPDHGQPGPSPSSRGRMGSYSSLADSMPSQPHDGNFRSPANRRNVMDMGGRNDRGDRFGPPSSQRQTSWSPGERRPLNGSPRSSSMGTKPMGYQGGPGGNGPPMAPSLSSRPPPNFRDLRHDARPDYKSSLSGPPPRRGDRVPPHLDAPGPPGPPGDGFGRNRDMNDRPPFNKNPRFSPAKQQPPKPFAGSPRANEHGNSNKVASALPRAALERGASSGDMSNNEPPKSKKVELPPLLTSNLGDEETVKRAETAVMHLSEVLGKPELKAENGEVSEVPAKPIIMSAMSTIEALVKEAQKQVEIVEEEKRAALKREEEARELEKKRLGEELAQKALEEERKRQEKEKALQEKKSQGLKDALDKNTDKLAEIQKNLEKELEVQFEEQKLQEEKRSDDDLKERLAAAESGFTKDMNKVKSSIEKARSNITKMESKVATAETEYQALLKSEEEESDKTKEAKPAETSSKEPSLVEELTVENRRKAQEANIFALAMVSENDIQGTEELLRDPSNDPTDPKYGKTFEEWSVLARQVSGLSDALYSEPSEAPYYQQNEQRNASLRGSVKEYIRDKNKRLVADWTELAEEYEVRRRLYDKQLRKLAKKAMRGSIAVSKKSIFAGDHASKETGTGIDRSNILESGGRSSSNPYRRARRGNEVRSEYEQEQIIAEIAAKEAMEKRIAHGGCNVPRQVSRLERELTASFVNTFTAKKIDDPLKEAEESEMDNMWTDMEKCIFLDRFLQFPKDFRRIASFLKNKSTKDCVAFYYDSKQTVPYKGALKEHVMRRKRKGDYQIWDASVQAAVSVGATVKAGSGEEKPVEFELPESDRTYRTYMLHPLRRRVIDKMEVDDSLAAEYQEESSRSEDTKWKSRKRARDPLFSLDKEQTKYLRLASQESMSVSGKSSTDDKQKTKERDEARDSAPTTPVRKPPQKWTVAEKKIFIETLEEHGRDWVKLAKAVGTKNEKQIKNFYYDWKKGKSRTPSDKRGGRKDKSGKSSDQPKKDSDEASTEGKGKHSGKNSGKAGKGDQEGSKSGEEQATDDEAKSRDGETVPDGEGSSATSQQVDEALAQEVGNLSNGNQELIQRLLAQQLQQPFGQQLQLGSQQPQSAIQQLLSQQHLQREQQQQSQLGQLSLEEARRILDHQQSQRGSLLNNLFSSQWLGASQLLQAQAGLPSHGITAALRGENSTGLAGMTELGDLQRLLQLQQSQGLGLPNHGSHLSSLLMGGAGALPSSATSSLSPALLAQLEGVAGSGTDASALANAQALLAYSGAGATGTGGLASALFRQGGGSGMESPRVSDALSLLARSMQHGDGNNSNFGRSEGK